jgi:predicted PurR-regulated permease PerM
MAEDKPTREVKAFVATAIAAALAFILVWRVANVLLLIIAGVLLAVFLRGIAGFLSRHTPMGKSSSYAIVVAAFILVGIAGFIFYIPLAADGIDQLTSQFPQTLQKLAEQLRQYEWGRRLLAHVAQADGWSMFTTDTFSRIAGIFSTALGALTGSLIILVIGLYLGAEPQVYIHGLVRLFPTRRRQRVREVLSALEYSLDWWLLGRIASMTVVGVLTWLGLVVLQIPMALTLAILAGLLSFVPNVGPILSAIPAILVGLAQSPSTALYVIGLYVAVQTVESYLITPLIQREAVLLPPALVMTMQLVFGLLFGFLGLLVATPLTVILVVLVKMLYLEDRLGEKVEVP